MPEKYYRDTLYPVQDKVLKTIEQLRLDFYLTGGTALGRCYLNHRYSDDLDFFVNDHKYFKKQCDIAVKAIKKHWACDVVASTDTFIRIFAEAETISLKIDFVNDIPYHYGDLQKSHIFHRIDSWRNILSNKLCALSRCEAKDIADIIFIAKNYRFEWETILSEAKEKDLWVDPIEVCRTINQFPADQLKTVKWIKKVKIDDLKKVIIIIHDDIFTGSENSVAKQDNGP
jgi:predicted nucleotidyltransferase component of viral defense system